MSEFKIEKGVPIPQPKSGKVGGWARALADADIGDSVFLAGRNAKDVVGGVGNHGNRWATVRTVEGGVRVWKIAEPGGKGQPPLPAVIAIEAPLNGETA